MLMNVRNWSIRKKLIGGFSLLTLLFIANATVSLFTLNKSAAIIQQNVEVADPSTLALRDLRSAIISSKGYITNWVYQQSNQEDKDALKQLHVTGYPKIKENISSLKTHWPESQHKLVDSVLTQYDTVQIKQKEIMTDLATFEDYEKDGGIVKFNANVTLETEVLPRSQVCLEQLNRIIVEKGQEAALNDEVLLANFDLVRQVILISAVVVVIFAVLATLVLSRDIVVPISYVRGIIQKLGLGELPEKQNRKFNRDEVGEMAEAVEKLAGGLRETSLFAENIGKGNYTPATQRQRRAGQCFGEHARQLAQSV